MAYGTLAGWRAWSLARGDSAPTDATDAVANAALTRATDYVKYSYVQRFVDPYDETSDNVEEATYVAADLELATPGFFSKTYTPTEQKTLTAVEGIKWTPVDVSSRSRGSVLATPTSTLIEAMLAPYLPADRGVSALMMTIGGQD